MLPNYDSDEVFFRVHWRGVPGLRVSGSEVLIKGWRSQGQGSGFQDCDLSGFSRMQGGRECCLGSFDGCAFGFWTRPLRGISVEGLSGLQVLSGCIKRFGDS